MKTNKHLFALCLVMILVFTAWGGVYGAEPLDEVRALISTHFYQEVPAELLQKASISEMIDALEDPYSTYIEPTLFQDFLSSLDGKFVGVGMHISETKDQQVQVASPMPGSPAEEAGIKAGDIIISVNKESVAGLSSSEVAGKIRGPEGSKVTLTIKRGKEHLDFTMVRKAITVPSLEYRLIGPGIGYINLYSFTSDSPREMTEALNELQKEKMSALVLDLRDNPGGLLDVTVDIAGNFVPKGAIVHVIQKGNREYTLQSFKTPRGIPVVVLVNENTASASEILAGAIQDANTGILVGTKTFGKGCVQTIFSLSNGGGLKLTTAEYLTRGRQEISNKGLVPNYVETDPASQLALAVKKLETEVPLFDLQIILGYKEMLVGYQSYGLPISPYLHNNNIMVPLRELVSRFGGSVRWNNKQTVVNLPQGKLIIESASGTIKTAAGKIIGRAILKNGYLTVPLRSLGEFMGYQTGWQPKTQSAYLIKKAN